MEINKSNIFCPDLHPLFNFILFASVILFNDMTTTKNMTVDDVILILNSCGKLQHKGHNLSLFPPTCAF